MASKLSIEIVQSDWLEAILADPIAKTALKKNGNSYYSESRFSYSITGNIPDFRIRLNQFESEWQSGQQHYEQSMIKYLDRGEQDNDFYAAEIKRDTPVYEKLSLEGRVLDVGGNLGAVRKYMSPNQEFCSLDPFINVYKLAEGRVSLFNNYPMHLPLNFIAGFAEFLPFAAASFDTVNMRSCLDHFFNPELSLLEANRILKNNGKLIIGMTLKVDNVSNTAKETTRKLLNLFTDKYQDKHMWHPAKDELLAMCSRCGFEPEEEIWQSQNVWYGSFRKNSSKLLSIT